MEIKAAQASTPSPAAKSENVPANTERKITAEDKYGTFKDLVAELNGMSKTTDTEKYKEKGVVTKYFDKDGNFVGGTYTSPGKDGKLTGIVTIGTVTYKAEDIKGKGLVTSIFDSKTGTYAKDKNNDGIINPSEISNFGPPTL